MDLSKLNIDTLNGSNWGTWAAQVQSAARILNCWDVIKGEVVVLLTTPPTYQLLIRPTAATQPDATLLAAELVAWTKKNSTVLGVLQGKMSSAIWPEFENHVMADTLWTALENKYGKAGGATTYLQVVSSYKVHMMDSTPLLPQIQNFQENYTWILANGHSKLSEDIATFIFCSSLPSSYQDLTSQYLTSIEDITKYSLQKIIARVIKEESRCKAWTNAVTSGLWIHKFAQINKYNKHCNKCGRNNHNTIDHWDTPPQHTNKEVPQKGNKKPKHNLSKGTDKKGKGEAPQKGQKQITNVKQINIKNLPNDEADYISDCESIDFSCYILWENSEWLIDLGCNRHVTSYLEDYVSYQQFVKPGNAEIANKQELPILGMGIVIFKHYHTDGTYINMRLDNVLYMPNASGCFHSTSVATQKGCEARETWLTTNIYSSNGTLLIEGTHKQATRLCYFNAQILQGNETNVPTQLSVINISSSNLWHQRLAHMNYKVIWALLTETTGGPDQKIQPPLKVCDGCEKGKSKCLPSPPLRTRAKHVLNLVHSNLDKMSSASIDNTITQQPTLMITPDTGWCSCLKTKVSSSEHSKPIKCGQSITQIDSSNASEQIEVVSSYPMNRRSSQRNLELNTKPQCQTLHNKMEEQNGSSKP